MSAMKNLALLALATGFATITDAQSTSGSGTTTRYWDCCKGSCSWPGKADVSNPVTICGKDDKPLTDYNTPSASDGGNGYMCSDQSPWVVNDDLAYGFAAVNIPGGSEASWCCACYELTFTSGPVSGKKMVVQATNTGGDLASAQFDLAIPGGGVGIFNACSNEWGAPSSGWGAQYGGISSNTCPNLPQALQPGCEFRFGDWFQSADNPSVDWKAVTCPKAITDKTGCVRSGETPTGGDSAATSAASTTAAAATSASSAYEAASSATSAAQSETPASSSVAAPVAASSSSSTSAQTYPAPSSSAAAPVASSSSASLSSSSDVSPAETYAASSATGEYSAPAAPTAPAAAPSGSSDEGGACAVQYVYAD